MNSITSSTEFPLDGKRVFVIAEIGNNHNGSVRLQKQAAGGRIHCCRSRCRQVSAAQPGSSVSPQGGWFARRRPGRWVYIQDLLDKVDLSVEQHRQLRAYCAAKNVTYICTPWDEPSVDALASFDVAALKIASADLSNPYLIAKAATLGRPLILSTGMSFEHEIRRTITQLNDLGAQFALLHCQQHLSRARGGHPARLSAPPAGTSPPP